MQEMAKELCSSMDFEFNMRDLLRWAYFICEYHDVAFGAEIIYICRLPNLDLQKKARILFSSCFLFDMELPKSDVYYDETVGLCFGSSKYSLLPKRTPSFPLSNLLLLPSQSTLLQQLCVCIRMNWIVLLNGPRLSGKSSLIETLSVLRQTNLKRMRLNKDTDASELLGSYEQV